jgi:hypothetical protein
LERVAGSHGSCERERAPSCSKTLGSYPTLGVGKAREEARKFLGNLATMAPPRVNRTFGQLAEDWLDVAKPNNSSWQLQKRRLEIQVLPKWRDRKSTFGISKRLDR